LIEEPVSNSKWPYLEFIKRPHLEFRYRNKAAAELAYSAVLANGQTDESKEFVLY
jgi:hypothetical protein